MQGAVAATHMVQAFHKAGVPPGVINLVTGAMSYVLDLLHAMLAVLVMCAFSSSSWLHQLLIRHACCREGQ